MHYSQYWTIKTDGYNPNHDPNRYRGRNWKTQVTVMGQHGTSEGYFSFWRRPFFRYPRYFYYRNIRFIIDDLSAHLTFRFVLNANTEQEARRLAIAKYESLFPLNVWIPNATGDRQLFMRTYPVIVDYVYEL